MRKFWVLVFLILFLSAAVFLYISEKGKDSYTKVLTFKKQGIEISLYSKSGSIRTGGNFIKITVDPPKGIKEFYFYMPPMPGMNEMRDVARLKEISKGVYEGSLHISMDGPWQIRVVFEDGSMITHDVFVPIVKGREEKPPVVAHGGHLMITPEKLQLIGIITEQVSKRKLVKTFSTVGYVEYNREKIYDITVRADAWVEKTYGRFEGEYVKKGTPLMKILSPEIQIAIEELKQAEKLGDRELIEKARRKLNYYKSSAVIRSPVDGVIIEKKVFVGGFVKEGFTAYRIADISEAWIIAEVPLKLANYVRNGTTALITSEENPEKVVEAKVDYIFPEVDKFSKTVKVRLKVKNHELTWKPFSLTEVIFEIPLGEVLAVPESAVIDTGKRTIVFVEMEKGMYMPVNVKLGRKAEGYYEVIHGLKEGDKVVVKGTFLLDAEAQIRGLYGEGGTVHHHH
ncbi:MAG: efflux transporter periplasmic adaptor subunit [Aquifex sp.]|nr:MAG: efflux transporter periplasmic adaptor subunit [Aquifex sp.]